MVKSEPTLDSEVGLTIVRAMHGFGDLYKIGRGNKCGALTRTTDWRGYTLPMVDLLTQMRLRALYKVPVDRDH